MARLIEDRRSIDPDPAARAREPVDRVRAYSRQQRDERAREPCFRRFVCADCITQPTEGAAVSILGEEHAVRRRAGIDGVTDVAVALAACIHAAPVKPEAAASESDQRDNAPHFFFDAAFFFGAASSAFGLGRDAPACDRRPCAMPSDRLERLHQIDDLAGRRLGRDRDLLAFDLLVDELIIRSCTSSLYFSGENVSCAICWMICFASPISAGLSSGSVRERDLAPRLDLLRVTQLVQDQALVERAQRDDVLLAARRVATRCRRARSRASRRGSACRRVRRPCRGRGSSSSRRTADRPPSPVRIPRARWSGSRPRRAP